MNEHIVEQRITGEYFYSLTRTVIETGDCISLTVYGIRIFNDNEQAFVEDISCDLQEVRELFLLAVEEQLFPEHLFDVVEDQLS